MNKKNYEFVEKYRPMTVKDCILPVSIKKVFMDFVDAKSFPNLLLSGPAGCGKTSLAKALCRDLGYEVLFINGSRDRNIDTVRTTLFDFSMSKSLNNKPKAIIMDEFEGMTPLAQEALKGFIEQFKDVRFIFTTNNKNRIIEPIQSRSAAVDFKTPEEEKRTLLVAFVTQAIDILKKENVKFDAKVVAGMVKRHFPDFRRVLNELQKYSSSGNIDTGIMNSTTNTELIRHLVGHIKKKDWRAIRQWAEDNNDYLNLQNDLYETLKTSWTDEQQEYNCPRLIMTIGEWMKHEANAKDPILYTAAFLTEVMENIKE